MNAKELADEIIRHDKEIRNEALDEAAKVIEVYVLDKNRLLGLRPEKSLRVAIEMIRELKK